MTAHFLAKYFAFCELLPICGFVIVPARMYFFLCIQFCFRRVLRKCFNYVGVRGKVLRSTCHICKSIIKEVLTHAFIMHTYIKWYYNKWHFHWGWAFLNPQRSSALRCMSCDRQSAERPLMANWLSHIHF